MATYIQTVSLPSVTRALSCLGPARELPGSPWKIGADNHIELFPRGSRAFAVAARSAAKDPERSVCFFPAYFCEGSLKPLREAGARIVFYRVTGELTPDWDDVRERANAEPPDLFVLVHTFGYIQDAAESRVFANETGCVLLEDAAHVLQPSGTLGQAGAIVLFSPHKLFALPPLSLLSIPRVLAERVKSPYPAAWRAGDWKWLGKRMIQKGIVACGGLGIRVRPGGSGFGGDEDGGQPAIEYPREVSRLGIRLLFAEQRYLAETARRRKENFAMLERVLMEMKSAEIPRPFTAWPEDAAPYAFPFFPGEDRAPAVYDALWRHGIPAQTWPDLPPEVSARPEEYSEALRWRRNLVLLPVHQSLNSSQMNAMIVGLKKVLNRNS